MPTVCLRDKHVIERFFRNQADLHVYSLGDLDDFFWPYTTWYALTIDQAPADSPMAAWGLLFPVEMGGMDECASPPKS